MLPGLNAALTPPRSKVRQITPSEKTMSYRDAARSSTDSKAPRPVNNKRQGSISKLDMPSSKRQNSNPTPHKLRQSKNSDPEELLDATNPEHAHKIKQRQKMISKGKNTAGYARYRSLIPMKKRKARSMETPTTPDPYVQMSNKRWQGCVRAWRIALHKYDPPELVQALQNPLPLTAPNGDLEEGEAVTTADKMILSPEQPKTSHVVDAVFSECKTPSGKSDTSKTSTPPSCISMKDASAEESSPCLSVVSRATPAKSVVKQSDRKPDARRELDKLFAEATTPEKEEKKAEKDKPARLTTGATGWGDDTSDEEDDELL